MKVFAIALLCAVPTAALADTPAEAPPTTVVTHNASFAETVSLALANNPDVVVAADRVLRAQGLLQQAASVLHPQGTYSESFQRLEGDRDSSGHEVESANSMIVAVGASIPLVDLRSRANRQRAKDQVEVAKADVFSTRRTVAITTASAYLAVFTAQRLIEVAQQARDTAQAHVKFAQQRRTGGLGTETDIVRAQTELATDEAQLSSAATAKARAQEALGILAGQDVPIDATAIPDLSVPDRRDSNTPVRADIVAQQRRVAAAEYSHKEQWTEWAPILGLSGNVFFDAPQIDPTPQVGFQILLSLSGSFYDGGWRAGLGKQRDADLADARTGLAQVERQANSDVRIAQVTVAHSIDTSKAAHASADFATHALDLVNIAYKGGAATELDVIDAQRSARDASTQAVIADDNLRQAQLDLLAAIGTFP